MSASVPSVYKAALLPAPGAQHEVGDRSLSPLESGEVAVKITATAVNPVDWKIRDYKLPFIQQYPTVLGSDAAGEVAALGPDVTGLAVGDRVFFQGILGKPDSCTFQQFSKIPAALVSRTPGNISDDQAAGIHLATVAGVTGFYDKTGHNLPAPWVEGGREVGKGKAVVVLGGGSSVGQYAIQLARLSGFERIVTSASPAHQELLTGLGAHVVLDRSKAAPEDFVAAIGDLPLEFIFDSISIKSTQLLGVKILQAKKTQGSRVILVGAVDEEAKELGQTQEPNVGLQGVIGLGSRPDLRYLSEAMAKHLGGEDGWIAQGLFVPNRVTLVEGGLANIEEALKKNKEGVSGQKVVFRPWE
ncbi:alcohol dehydrogenase [Paramyrothecium foliicola]|nr:alcohol dehydrogenase [Paramyrothecium foliicola]